MEYHPKMCKTHKHIARRLTNVGSIDHSMGHLFPFGEEVKFNPESVKNVFTARSTISVWTRLARDKVGLNIKELDKNYMPGPGDVIAYKKDTTFGHVQRGDS